MEVVDIDIVVGNSVEVDSEVIVQGLPYRVYPNQFLKKVDDNQLYIGTANREALTSENVWTVYHSIYNTYGEIISTETLENQIWDNII